MADAAKPKDLEPLALVCGQENTDAGDVGDRCKSGDDCARGACLLAGACAVPCASDEQCGPLERCQDVFARTAAASLQPVRACVQMVCLPEEASVMVDVRDNALSGATESANGTLVLPLDPVRLPGATPTTWFVLEHPDDDAWPLSTFCRPPLCPITLRTRGKTPAVLFDRTAIDERCLQDAPPEQFTGPRNPVNDDDHADPIVVMLPNGPRSIVTDAGYEILVSDEVPGDLRLITIAHDTTDDDGGARTLDLDVYWIGVDRDDGVIDDAVADVDEVWKGAAITIGEVRHIDVSGGLVGRGATFPEPDARDAGFDPVESIFGVHAELPALMRLSAGACEPAVNVFLVSGISPRAGSGDDPIAVGGGIPGPPGMHGTGSSGIVIELDALRASPRTLAHELAHHLGLFHTSERLNGERGTACVFEPLPDTPECHVGRDSDGDGRLSCEECAGAGARNLMFPTPCGGSDLSPDQIAILRTAPVLRR